MVEVGELELIKIRYNILITLRQFLGEAVEAFAHMTKLVEAFGLKNVL